MLKLQSQILQRFAELAQSGEAIRVGGQSTRQAESQSFYAWAASALNLLHGVFGKDSPHYAQLQAEMSAIQNNFVSERHLQACKGIFLGAKSDADGGYLFRVEASVAGEVFGDFVALAKASLDEGHHTVAAVLACAALEDALKRFAGAQGLVVEDKTMEEVVNALRSNGSLSGAQKALLGAMPKVRNHAMHAEWHKLSPQDAGSVIGYVEQFLLLHFP